LLTIDPIDPARERHSRPIVRSVVACPVPRLLHPVLVPIQLEPSISDEHRIRINNATAESIRRPCHTTGILPDAKTELQFGLAKLRA